MTQDLIEKSTTAPKEDPLIKRSAKFLLRKLRTIIKRIRRKFTEYNGNFYYGETAQDYENIRTKKDWWHAENQVVAEVLKQLPKGLSILDVPFGTGRFLPLYAECEMKVTGLDISYAMLSTATNLRKDLMGRCKLDVGDARYLPYENNSFDAVLSFRFLDGIITYKDHKKVLSELVRVTKKYLILEVFAVPNGDDAKLLIKNLKENQLVNGRLSEIERKKLFESFGIKVINRMPAALEEGMRQVVYLCEKCVENSLSDPAMKFAMRK